MLDDDHTEMNLVRFLVKGIQRGPQTPTMCDKSCMVRDNSGVLWKQRERGINREPGGPND